LSGARRGHQQRSAAGCSVECDRDSGGHEFGHWIIWSSSHCRRIQRVQQWPDDPM